ncbi:glycosyltransferase family A protein [Terribacillus sp. 7520-G]|uniref:glycosyltransferase family 2 protein n=1 Tax=Terribacillus sp. 7520-G TaxID=2025389 RepID=UPI00117C8C3D|nr:glycosyltransferase family A protein [Terribacillus sp. 7520-G]
MDLVSIIVPTYNGSKTIRRALESALKQDYTNIEIIVVDDNGLGSSEQKKTEETIADLIEKYNVTYIKHKVNINGSAARNTGVKSSKGKYIALLDDDDVYLPFKIRLQLEALKGKGEEYGACYTSYKNIFPSGRIRETLATESGDLCFSLLAMKISVLSSVLLIRRSAWDEINGFDATFKRNQDQEFCVRLFNKYKVAVVKEICMVRYILRRNSPENVYKGVEYRNYYISKMKPIIKSFERGQQKQIYFAHQLDISKRYLKAKKYNKCLVSLFRSKRPLSGFSLLLKDYVEYKSSKRNLTNKN